MFQTAKEPSFPYVFEFTAGPLAMRITAPDSTYAIDEANRRLGKMAAHGRWANKTGNKWEWFQN